MRDDEKAYNWNSFDASAAASTFPFYLQNDSADDLLIIDLIRVGGVETALWKIHFVSGTAAGGSSLTPVNLNNTSLAPVKIIIKSGS